MNLIQTLAAFQTFSDEVSDDLSEAGDWWSNLMFGEPRGIDWMWMLGGVLFFCFIGYGIYSTMLYNQIGANRHPANFRKLIIALVILFSIVWFGYVFSEVFGLYMLIILFAVWLLYFLVFIFTRRRVASTQS